MAHRVTCKGIRRSGHDCPRFPGNILLFTQAPLGSLYRTKSEEEVVRVCE